MGRPAIGDHAMTSAERQARRRERFRQMKDALKAITEANTLAAAHAIAHEALKNASFWGNSTCIRSRKALDPA